MIQFPASITSRFPQSGHECTPSLISMSLYSIASDLFEFTGRIERSRSVAALTARGSTSRESPHREPRTREDLELPKISPSKESPTEQAPTLDILADCLEYIHQVQIKTLACFLSRVIGIQYLRDDNVRSFKHSLCSGISLSCIAYFKLELRMKFPEYLLKYNEVCSWFY